MARPVEALRAMRGLARAGGAIIIADERVGAGILGRRERRGLAPHDKRPAGRVP